MCARRFKGEEDLEGHVKNDGRFSMNEFEPFNPKSIAVRCSKCEAEFTNRRDLTTHYTRQHTPVKPFVCHICSKAYARKRDLTAHRNKKGHTPQPQELKEVDEDKIPKQKEVKRFDCPQCPATFRFKSVMQVHLRTHTGERPYVCSCGRGFSRKHDMQVHQKAFGHFDSGNTSSAMNASVSTPASGLPSDFSLGGSESVLEHVSTNLSGQVSDQLAAENVSILKAEHQEESVASMSTSSVSNVCQDYGCDSRYLQSHELEGKNVNMLEKELGSLCATSDLSVDGRSTTEDASQSISSSNSNVDVCDGINSHKQAEIDQAADSTVNVGGNMGKCGVLPPDKVHIDSASVTLCKVYGEDQSNVSSHSHSDSDNSSSHLHSLSLSNVSKPIGSDLVEGFKPLLSKVLSFRFSDNNLAGEKDPAVQMQASETQTSLCSQLFSHYKSAKYFSSSIVAKQIATSSRKKPWVSNSPENNLRSPEKKGPFECPFCPAVFKFWSLMDVHSRKHTGTRPFVCSCGRGFSRKHDMQKHQQKFSHSPTDDNEPAPSRNVYGKLMLYANIKSEASDKLNEHTETLGDRSSSEDPNVCENNPSTHIPPFVLTSEAIGDVEGEVGEVTVKPEFSNSSPESRCKNKRFKCSHCSAVFRFRSLLVMHARTHSRERPYPCLCGRAYTRKHDRKVHQQKCQEYLSEPVRVKQNSDRGLGKMLRNSQEVGSSGESIKYLQCTKCPSRFKRHGAFSLHQEWHLREKPFVCGTCNRSFIRKCDLSSHLNHYGHGGADLKPKQRGHFVKPGPDGQFSCPKCPAIFSFKSSLNTHKAKHVPARPYVCDTCGRGFTRKHDRRMHQKTFGHLPAENDAPKQGPPYKCPDCPATFKFMCYLKYHAVKHTGKGPLACNQCTASFVKQSDLMIHKRRHNGERPFLCSLCGYKFSSQGHLTIHVRRKHTGERPFMCSFCGKGFVDRGSMRQHEKVHSEEKDYSCRFCDERFTQLARRWKHEKMQHTEEALKRKLSKQIG